jgi:hypothetical protein
MHFLAITDFQIKLVLRFSCLALNPGWSLVAASKDPFFQYYNTDLLCFLFQCYWHFSQPLVKKLYKKLLMLINSAWRIENRRNGNKDLTSNQFMRVWKVNCLIAKVQQFFSWETVYLRTFEVNVVDIWLMLILAPLTNNIFIIYVHILTWASVFFIYRCFLK